MATLELMVRAFIPSGVSGGFRIAAGSHAGKTAIHGPGSSLPGNLHSDYLTDQRVFSSMEGASSRVETRVVIDLASATISRSNHRADSTISVHHTTGAVQCQQTASMSRMQVQNLGMQKAAPPATPRMSGKLRLIGQANNPCVAGSPDIDWNLTFTIGADASGQHAEVKVEGRVEPFPAFECYVRLASGTFKLLFMISPQAGADPWNLFGGPTVPVNAHMSL